MKKVLMILISAVILSTAFAGCGYDPLADGARTTTAATSETETATEGKIYDNTFEGLETYMTDKGYIEKVDNRIEMKADLIGAEKGYRYIKGNVTVELYEYNTTQLNEKAQVVLNSVKKDGIYTIYDTKVEAYLAQDGKYMMVYYDKDIAEGKNNQAVEVKKQAIADFENFCK